MCPTAAARDIFNGVVRGVAIGHQMSLKAAQEPFAAFSGSVGLILKDTYCLAGADIGTVHPHSRFRLRRFSFFLEHLYHGFVGIDDAAFKKLLFHQLVERLQPFFGNLDHPVRHRCS